MHENTALALVIGGIAMAILVAPHVLPSSSPCPHPPGKGWVWLPEIRAWSQQTPTRWRIVSCDGEKVYVPHGN